MIFRKHSKHSERLESAESLWTFPVRSPKWFPFDNLNGLPDTRERPHCVFVSLKVYFTKNTSQLNQQNTKLQLHQSNEINYKSPNDENNKNQIRLRRYFSSASFGKKIIYFLNAKFPRCVCCIRNKIQVDSWAWPDLVACFNCTFEYLRCASRIDAVWTFPNQFSWKLELLERKN